jgi:hypothetical protein
MLLFVLQGDFTEMAELREFITESARRWPTRPSGAWLQLGYGAHLASDIRGWDWGLEGARRQTAGRRGAYGWAGAAF